MRPNAGFTLPEVLVACLLLAILAVMAHRAFNAVVATRERIAGEAGYWRGLDDAFARLESDFANLDPLAPVDLPDRAFAFRLSGGRATGNLDYVAYRLRGETLEWQTWQAPATPETAPVTALLSGIRSFKTAWIGEDRVWREQRPPAGKRLLGLRVELTTARGETYSRVFAQP